MGSDDLAVAFFNYVHVCPAHQDHATLTKLVLDVILHETVHTMQYLASPSVSSLSVSVRVPGNLFGFLRSGLVAGAGTQRGVPTNPCGTSTGGASVFQSVDPLVTDPDDFWWEGVHLHFVVFFF